MKPMLPHYWLGEWCPAMAGVAGLGRWECRVGRPLETLKDSASDLPRVVQVLEEEHLWDRRQMSRPSPPMSSYWKGSQSVTGKARKACVHLLPFSFSDAWCAKGVRLASSTDHKVVIAQLELHSLEDVLAYYGLLFHIQATCFSLVVLAKTLSSPDWLLDCSKLQRAYRRRWEERREQKVI